jgi:protein required for attachment to host cells
MRRSKDADKTKVLEPNMARLHPRTWILVADSARARALAWAGQDAALLPIDGFDFHYHHQHGRDLMTDRPGRVHESQGTTRHAIEPRIDPVRQTEQRFAATIADALAHAHCEDAFDRVIVIAGPTMLGDLRASFSPAVRAAVLTELAKDLTHLTNSELLHYIREADLLRTPVVPDAS